MGSEVEYGALDEEMEGLFEQNMLRNGRKFSAVFERIFQKYDREFMEDECGGAVIESDTEIDQLINSQETDFADPRSAILDLSNSSDSDSDGESESTTEDPEVAALLHQEVVRIKKEIRWDEEETKHQEKQKLKALQQEPLSDDSDYEGERTKCVVKMPQSNKRRISPKRCRTVQQQKASVGKKHLSLSLVKIDPARKMVPNYTSGYEDLNTTNCTLETALEEDDDSEVVSAPEGERLPPLVRDTTILSNSMCELGGDCGGHCSQSDSETDGQDIRNETLTKTNSSISSREQASGAAISRVSSNEFVSGYDTIFESDQHEVENDTVKQKEKSGVKSSPEDDKVQPSLAEQHRKLEQEGDNNVSKMCHSDGRDESGPENDGNYHTGAHHSLNTYNVIQCACCDKSRLTTEPYPQVECPHCARQHCSQHNPPPHLQQSRTPAPPGPSVLPCQHCQPERQCNTSCCIEHTGHWPQPYTYTQYAHSHTPCCGANQLELQRTVHHNYVCDHQDPSPHNSARTEHTTHPPNHSHSQLLYSSIPPTMTVPCSESQYDPSPLHVPLVAIPSYLSEYYSSMSPILPPPRNSNSLPTTHTLTLTDSSLPSSNSSNDSRRSKRSLDNEDTSSHSSAPRDKRQCL